MNKKNLIVLPLIALLLTGCKDKVKELYVGNAYASTDFLENYYDTWNEDLKTKVSSQVVYDMPFEGSLHGSQTGKFNVDADQKTAQGITPSLTYVKVEDQMNPGNKDLLDWYHDTPVEDKGVGYGPTKNLSTIDKSFAYGYLSKLYDGRIQCDGYYQRSRVQMNDKGYGTERFANIWEGGLYDGKNNETDCQLAIRTGLYGVRMADYTMQSLLAGVNGICYWDFDDGMHFMYNSEIPTPKEWGMFSSLEGVSAEKQELRPWYHSSVLLTQMLKKGNKIYGSDTNNPELDKTFRCLGTTNQDNTQAGFMCVNQGTKAVEKTFRFDNKIEGEKLYIYQFSDKNYKLDEEGFIAPNYVIDGSLNKQLKLTINAHELMVVSTEKL